MFFGMGDAPLPQVPVGAPYNNTGQYANAFQLPPMDPQNNTFGLQMPNAFDQLENPQYTGLADEESYSNTGNMQGPPTPNPSAPALHPMPGTLMQANALPVGNNMQGNMQNNAMQNNAMQGNAMQGNAMQGNAMQGTAMQGNTMQGSTMQGNAMQGSTIPMQGNTLQANTMTANAMQMQAAMPSTSMPSSSMQGGSMQANPMQASPIQGMQIPNAKAYGQAYATSQGLDQQVSPAHCMRKSSLLPKRMRVGLWFFFYHFGRKVHHLFETLRHSIECGFSFQETPLFIFTFCSKSLSDQTYQFRNIPS